MWRAMFLAIGAYLCILGAQCLAVEKVVLKIHKQPKGVQTSILADASDPGPKMTIVPPAYAPWSLMATGAIVFIYSITIPTRLKR